MKTVTQTQWEGEVIRRGRNYTDAPIGYHSSGKRDRDAKLSALFTADRRIRMFRRPSAASAAPSADAPQLESTADG